MRKLPRIITAAAAMLMLAATLPANDLVELRSPEPDEIQAIGFELTRGGMMTVDAVGMLSEHDDDELTAYAWIIDAETREPVWVMDERNTDRMRRGMRRETTDIELEAGRYEVYLFGGTRWGGNVIINWSDKDGDGWFDDLFGGWSDDDLRRLRDCEVVLSSAEISPSAVETFDVTGEFGDPLFRAARVGDDERIEWAFTLDKPMSVRIYALLEHPRGYRTPVDGGWLVNSQTRERVWELDRWDSDRAGGDRKNRVYNDELPLEAGTYVLHYVTDDSHSWEEFNARPPYDPMNWGVTVFPGENFDRAAFSESEIPSSARPLVDLTRARNDEFTEQAFRVDRDMDFHVVAIGEYATGSREFADYGFIENAATGRIVWEMTFRNTEHAGGAEKNRMFDGTVFLPKGEYIASYVTDGSHSYRRWNSAAPWDPAAWGMAIYALNDSDGDALTMIRADEITRDQAVLAAITRVGNSERRRAIFTLEEEASVRVYAIGEGTGGRMYDYAWIEDDRSGRVVWEMMYEDTRNAGGAQKNRLSDDIVTLRPGTYRVYYVTDDSHSYNSWNSTRPRDFRNWGITISLLDGQP